MGVANPCERYLYWFSTLVPCTLGAVAGIGGGIIIKPVLSIIGTLNVAAINYLCAFTIFSMSCVTLALRARRKQLDVDMHIGIPLALGAVVGGALGKYLFHLVKTSFGSPALLSAVQSGLLATLIAGVFVYSLRKNVIRTHHLQNRMIIFVTSLLLGVIAAFIGIGGGPFNVAILYWFFSMDVKKAVLNSVFIIFFSQLANIIFTICKNMVPDFTWAVFVFMIAGGIAGGVVGTRLSAILSLKGVDKIYNAVLIVVFLLAMYNFCYYYNQI